MEHSKHVTFIIKRGLVPLQFMTMNSPPPTPTGTVSDYETDSQISTHEDLYEMLISDLLLYVMVNPRQRNAMELLFRRLVVKGHTGLQPFLDEIGPPASPTRVTGSRANLNRVRLAPLNTGNSSSP